MLRKHFVTMLVIVAISIVAYRVVVKQMSLLTTVATSSSHEALELSRSYESALYEALLSEVTNNKREYILLVGLTLVVFLVLVFNVLKLITRFDPKVLLRPERYEVVSKADADVLRLVLEQRRLRLLKKREQEAATNEGQEKEQK